MYRPNKPSQNIAFFGNHHLKYGGWKRINSKSLDYTSMVLFYNKHIIPLQNIHVQMKRGKNILPTAPISELASTNCYNSWARVLTTSSDNSTFWWQLKRKCFKISDFPENYTIWLFGQWVPGTQYEPGIRTPFFPLHPARLLTMFPHQQHLMAHLFFYNLFFKNHLVDVVISAVD